ncbi:MAG TPA: rhomboid family intramembrane serine protease, partial [Candidatus Acidoferrales bacterium]|nr:rhomboid family intramembrane serine protease [Candidatus Acidoferrales bacterium]
MKKCTYCGLENYNDTVECVQCTREEFVVINEEGKSVAVPPRLGPASVSIRCSLHLREAAPGSLSPYQTVMSSWGGLKRGFLTIDDQHLVVQQRLTSVGALLIAVSIFIFGSIIVGFMTLNHRGTGDFIFGANLVLLLVVSVPIACALWIGRRRRQYGFDQLIRGKTLGHELVLELRRKPVVPPLQAGSPDDGTAVQPDGELTLKFFQPKDFMLLTQRLSAAGVKFDDSTAQAAQVINSFAERLNAVTPRCWVTFTLLTVNSVIYLLMYLVLAGNFTTTGLQSWGANYGPLTINGGQWWRLLACCFLHGGFLHVLLNMYVLYQVGQLVEKLFGNWFYLLIYLACGICASLTSVWIHPAITSVGASGAIFGLYGALVGYLMR